MRPSVSGKFAAGFANVPPIRGLFTDEIRKGREEMMRFYTYPTIQPRAQQTPWRGAAKYERDKSLGFDER